MGRRYLEYFFVGDELNSDDGYYIFVNLSNPTELYFKR